MTMEGAPDTRGRLQSHCETKEEADAFAADIEKLAALEGLPLPHITIERNRQGGWSVWVWE
jgi:hypothetical protein